MKEKKVKLIVKIRFKKREYYVEQLLKQGFPHPEHIYGYSYKELEKILHPKVLKFFVNYAIGKFPIQDNMLFYTHVLLKFLRQKQKIKNLLGVESVLIQEKK